MLSIQRLFGVWLPWAPQIANTQLELHQPHLFVSGGSVCIFEQPTFWLVMLFDDFIIAGLLV